MNIDTTKITRVTVVDENGRAYEKWDISDCQLSLQDGGRTLKLFLYPSRNGDVARAENEGWPPKS